ncbi:MAG: NAD(P)/FAD-dependent oxidoreductase [Elusimicrobiota bacterium]|jgi:all-trans-retinol 13,14-reductase|nr:NAD(P)/FAD-dependent oxidoreductase [Elusimicrobiota bacterium]
MLNYDELIIGGGISGMAASLLSAKRGKKTALLEAGATLSPTLSGFTRAAAHFETGFHYAFGLGEGEIGQYFFDLLGLDIKSYPLLQNGYDEIHLPSGRIVKLAYPRQNLEHSLGEVFPEEKENLKKYLDKLEDCFLNSAYLNLHRDKTLDLNAPVDTPKSLQEVLDECFKSDEIKAVLAASSFLHGTPPNKISFGMHACIAGGLFHGAYGVLGGGKAIVNAFEKALKKAGVDVFLNTKATSIEEDGDKKIIRTNKDSFACDICISSIHPKEFLKIAPQNAYREGYKTRVNALEETPGFFTLYAKYKGPRVEASNIYLLSKTNVVDCFNTNSNNPSYYINFSPDKEQNVSIISFTSPEPAVWNKNSPDYQERKNNYSLRIKNDINKLAPDIAKYLEYIEVSTPATSRRYVGYSGGYGLMHDMYKTKVLPMTKIKGLYLCGQSVLVPGLLGSIITSLMVDKMAEAANV